MKRNICKQSETFRRSYIFRDSQTKKGLDLSGCTAYSQIRTKPGGELVADAECIIDTKLSRVTALWTAEQTAEITPGTYYFDIWLKSGEDQKPFTTEIIEMVPPITVIGE